MSLLRFLKFGRAFNQGNGMGRYKLPRHGALPRFNVNREPSFKSTAMRTMEKPQMRRPETTVMNQSADQLGSVQEEDTLERNNVAMQRPAAKEAESSAKANTVRLPTPTQPLPREHQTEEVKSKKRKDWGWTRKLNPFSGRSEKQESKPVEFVQREFSLDEVKPVRNDLSDSDLELVSVVQPTQEKKPVESGEDAEKAHSEANTFWGRLSDKLFDAGRTP